MHAGDLVESGIDVDVEGFWWRCRHDQQIGGCLLIECLSQGVITKESPYLGVIFANGDGRADGIKIQDGMVTDHANELV